jgi:teichuronic acid biosynthesis glycosyltransferase TuaG
MPLVSVIMPVFNYAQYVGDSIASVLKSTEENLELIVVDDGSTDNSKALIEAAAKRDSRVKPIFHEKNLGISAARNTALAAAKGEYIAFCDADDLWLPEKLENQLKLLAQTPGADIAYGESKIIDEDGKETGARFSTSFPIPGSGNGNLFPTLCVRNFINTQTVLLRRNILGPENTFDVNIHFAEDWLFWIRLARSHEFVYSAEPVGFYRMHDANSASAVQFDGRKRNRVKVFLAILGFPDLPRGIVSQVFYHLGVALSGLKNEAFTSAFAYKESLKYNPFNWRSAVRLILCTIRK